MNIFILSEDPIQAAESQCDKHVVKMILESAQMLSTAHWLGWSIMFHLPTNMKQKEKKRFLRENVSPDLQPSYSMTHVNHPCTIWARETKRNYLWLCMHAKALCNEYTKRYGKRHKSEDVIDWLCIHIPPHLINCKNDLTPFAQAMPNQYKDDSPVVAYRKYYIEEKAAIAKWKYTQAPAWFVTKS